MDKYIFLSFRDPDINKNLGCAIVKAKDLNEAIVKAHKKKINPGGEVLGTPMSEKDFKEEGLELDKLYSRQEMIDLGY